MGDERTYEETCVLRCINSVDGMTADVTSIDVITLSEVATKIVNGVPRVNKVLYDITRHPVHTSRRAFGAFLEYRQPLL